MLLSGMVKTLLLLFYERLSMASGLALGNERHLRALMQVDDDVFSSGKTDAQTSSERETSLLR